MSYIADTHAVLWHIFPGPRYLSPVAQAIFDACEKGKEQIVIPAVVLAEMIAIVERGRLPDGTVPLLLDRIKVMQSGTNYRFLSLRTQTILESHSLTAIPEIFDRLIVADARRLGFPVITRDQQIINSGLVSTVW
jgi:PIN domain nuclease of toxin-antitoxin system